MIQVLIPPRVNFFFLFSSLFFLCVFNISFRFIYFSFFSFYLAIAFFFSLFRTYNKRRIILPLQTYGCNFAKKEIKEVRSRIDRVRKKKTYTRTRTPVKDKLTPPKG